MNHWELKYKQWEKEKHPLTEALCTLGNGYIATRGAFEEQPANEYNYPGTYLAGGYNRAISEIKGKHIENEDLVNWPNWLPLSLKVEDDDWLDLDALNLLDFEISLNLKEGVLERKIRFEDHKNRVTSLLCRRIVCMHDPHVAAIEWTIIPENWEGKLMIRSGIDGDISNAGVERYSDLNNQHIEVKRTNITDNGNLILAAQTLQSKIIMGMSASTQIYQNEEKIEAHRDTNINNTSAWEKIQLTCSKLEPVYIEKTVAVFTSRDLAISDPITEATSKLQENIRFGHLLTHHRLAWEQNWARSNFDIETDNNDILILRLHIFHIHQTVSQNSIGLDVGVPSRGWHGEAYRGHIFWDELYVFPYINLHMPQLARSLLMYRYHRLPKARLAAKKNGYRGAMYPWQSGSNGREESQEIHLNPKSGRWIPDTSRYQRHINAAIPYNIWQYFQATNDMDFLTSYGAEIIFNTALFWSSIAEYNPKRDRYVIRAVMGPDEYHTSYPESDVPGLNNNAYTNFMAVWVLRCALRLQELFDDDVLSELARRVGFTDDDISEWKLITQKMYIPFLADKIILQFEGFDKLKELNWEEFRKNHGDSMRLDRILEEKNDTPNKYRACKQADVLMLFYLFSSEELKEIFEQLGYTFKPSYIPENIDYYQKITSHGSTLSQVIHSWVYSRSDRERSWSRFKKALKSDIEDVQGGTTPEGIHLGAMAGTVDLMQRCYTGIEIRDDALWLNPRLPKEIRSISLHIRYRSHWIKLIINHQKLELNFTKGWAEPVTIYVKGKKRRFERDDSATFELT